jgi:hypothetical protein
MSFYDIFTKKHSQSLFDLLRLSGSSRAQLKVNHRLGSIIQRQKFFIFKRNKIKKPPRPDKGISEEALV